MANKKKNMTRPKEKKVVLSLRGPSIGQIEDLLSKGLHGKTLRDVAQIVLDEGLELRRGSDPSNYRIIVELEGYSAFAVLNYIKLTKGERKQVVDFIFYDWISRNWKQLSDAGINFQNPDWQRYLKKRK